MIRCRPCGGFPNTCHVDPLGVWDPPGKAKVAQSKTQCQNLTGVLTCPLCVALKTGDTNSRLLACLLTHSFFHLFVHSSDIEWFIITLIITITINSTAIYLESSIFQALCICIDKSLHFYKKAARKVLLCPFTGEETKAQLGHEILSKQGILEVAELGCGTKLSDTPPPHPQTVVFSVQNITFVNKIAFYGALEKNFLILITESRPNHTHFLEIGMSLRQVKWLARSHTAIVWVLNISLLPSSPEFFKTKCKPPHMVVMTSLIVMEAVSYWPFTVWQKSCQALKWHRLIQSSRPPYKVSVVITK